MSNNIERFGEENLVDTGMAKERSQPMRHEGDRARSAYSESLRTWTEGLAKLDKELVVQSSPPRGLRYVTAPSC